MRCGCGCRSLHEPAPRTHRQHLTEPCSRRVSYRPRTSLDTATGVPTPAEPSGQLRPECSRPVQRRGHQVAVDGPPVDCSPLPVGAEHPVGQHQIRVQLRVADTGRKMVETGRGSHPGVRPTAGVVADMRCSDLPERQNHDPQDAMAAGRNWAELAPRWPLCCDLGKHDRWPLRYPPAFLMQTCGRLFADTSPSPGPPEMCPSSHPVLPPLPSSRPDHPPPPSPCTLNPSPIPPVHLLSASTH